MFAHSARFADQRILSSQGPDARLAPASAGLRQRPEHGWGPASAMFGACPLKMSAYCCIRQICSNRALPVGKIANNYRDLKCAGKLSQNCPIDLLTP
jgi:hypothetical protein